MLPLVTTMTRVVWTVVAIVSFVSSYTNGGGLLSVEPCTNNQVASFSSTPSNIQYRSYQGSISTGNIIKKKYPKHTVSYLIRGGGSSTNLSPPALDMDRMRIRLDGLGQYAVICALLLNVCLNIYFNTIRSMEFDTLPKSFSSTSTFKDRLQIFCRHGKKLIQLVFMLSSITSIISSAYTAVVFTLEGLYAKAALGMGNDNDFLIFFSATQKLRDSAFQAFVVSLFNFNLSFFTSIMIVYKGQYRALILTLTAICLLVSWYHWASIMTLAGQLLYYAHHDATGHS